jgi:hypothetical protein
VELARSSKGASMRSVIPSGDPELGRRRPRRRR